MGLLEDVQSAGTAFTSTDAADVPEVLRQHLGQLVGDSFVVTTGRINDRTGAESEPFAAIVSCQTPHATPVVSTADACAAVVDAHGTLDKTGLEAAYERISGAKKLSKLARPTDTPEPHTTVTLGLVIAQSLALSDRELLDEIQRLNNGYPSNEWPDLIAVAGLGVINYAVQFPGETLSGDYLPPARGALQHSVPPMYVVPIIRPEPEHPWRQLISYLLAHLAFFSPGVRLPDRRALVTTGVGQVIAGAGYQYDLQGELQLVPPECRIGRQLTMAPLQILGPQGADLGAVSFLKWQDGGVVILRGHFPLEALLLCGDSAHAKAGVIARPNDRQVSNVLAMDERGFDGLLREFERKSNMRIRRRESALTLQKIADEGTETPYSGSASTGNPAAKGFNLPE